ncbi:tyrosyl-DNA phosphodiesterase 2-like isoform X2 [Biomphalaria glabrata]|uniref:Tyrosyl-DNA phosphodiesterase 2-like isoform X2 n=1 Tax=Biomphalaria glabrata TaxID=6526 RepID=A0A9W3AV60_BIOGL|nr:tyrosyl-DNA phosphodiesterase 2-like isoform X2 [Biomphalaria glabrata]
METARTANRLRLLSYNLDGLDPEDLMTRAEGACNVLLHENPEVIFLQEVVTDSLPIIRARCMPDYDIFLGLEGKRRGPCQIKSVPVTLLNSHLESIKQCSGERRNQLSQAFARMRSADKTRVVLFGGDLNLRDSELTDFSAVPANVVDIWEYTGKKPQTEFTWNLRSNDNRQFDSPIQPQFRFDRIYMRNSDPPLLNPVNFELKGIWRLESCERFPSDHWGILCHFDILSPGSVNCCT